MQKITLFIETSEKTEIIAEQLGSNLHGGECIELVSDLGGGKTTFTRGLVRGLGSLDSVSSPTFTIGKQYTAGDKVCYHFDFYRLQEPGLVAEELSEALENPNGIIIVEWADTVSEVLPSDRIIITIDRVADSSESRKMTISTPENLAYITSGVA
jgi:tRNA threonylcarbamoyladenosine biosynthesis protein TsaE